MPGKRSVLNSYSSRALKKFVKSFSLAHHDNFPQFKKLLNGFIFSSTLPHAFKLFVENLRRGPHLFKKLGTCSSTGFYILLKKVFRSA